MSNSGVLSAVAPKSLRWRDRIPLLGSWADSLTIDEAVGFVGDMIRAGGWHLIVATNANKLWQVRRDKRLAGVMDRAALIIPEWAAVWGAARLGRPLRGFIAGISLMQRLLPEAERMGWRVYFLGARPEIVERMVALLRKDYPSLQIAGWHHGYFKPDNTPEIRQQIADSGADLMFVAMGSPKQEYWLDEYGPTLGVKVALGVGGSFDVLSGFKKDTPSWARGRGLEWIYRLWLDPKNLWKRYLITNTWFVWAIARDRMRALWSSTPAKRSR